jgi:hypothetical protein
MAYATLIDLFNGYCDLLGEAEPTRTAEELRAEFQDRTSGRYERDAWSFLDAIFYDGWAYGAIPVGITTHTPGPWTADTGDHEGTDVLTGHHDNCCGVMATIHNQPGEDMPGTVEVANARLIAAAPEMLAALQELDEAYRFGTSVGNVDHYTYGIIKSAIEKATGE